MKKWIALLPLALWACAAGGQCWEVVFNDTVPRMLAAMHFPTSSHGWAFLSKSWVPEPNAIIRTANGGEDWEVLEIPPQLQSSNAKSLFFIDTLRGFASNDDYGSFYATADGGLTWEKVTGFPPAPTTYNAIVPPIVRFFGEQDGWAMFYRNGIFKTADGGQSWGHKLAWPSGPPRHVPIFAYFLSADKAWATIYVEHSEHRLYHTQDGGETWQVQLAIPHSPGARHFNHIFFLDEQTGWLLSGEPKTLYATQDGGQSWSLASGAEALPASAFHLYFIDGQRGWLTDRYCYMCCCDDPDSPNSGKGILYTPDGGQSWKVHNHEKVPIFSVSGLDTYYPGMGLLQMFGDSVGYAGTTPTFHGKIYRYRGRPAACGPLAAPLPSPAPLQPLLSWPAAHGCFDGYYLQLGSAPGADDILPRQDVGQDTFYQVAGPLPQGATVYAAVLPYNHVFGAAEGCESRVFTTVECPPLYTAVDTGFCQGGALAWGDTLIAAPGLYTLSYRTALGCDSIVALQVAAYESAAAAIDTAVCEGRALLWGDSALTAPGHYEFRYATAQGCDSTLSLSLAHWPRYLAAIDTSYCQGGAFYWADSLLPGPGAYTFFHRTQHGCDSIEVVLLERRPPAAGTLDTAYCAGRGFYWEGSLLPGPGEYSFGYTTAAGCDSTLLLRLSELPASYGDTAVALLPGELYGGVAYERDTVLLEAHAAANGCDSILRVYISVLTGSAGPGGPAAGWRCYPNPTAGELWAEGAEPLLGAQLLGIGGARHGLSWQAEGGGPPWRYRFSLAGLPPGAYLLRLESRSGAWAERIVVY
jgi:photosystem II stability/assembly factor-like uncharacterized protein